MKTIWKYPIHVRDTVAIEMPKEAHFLPTVATARLEYGEHGLVVWAEVDPDQPTETRILYVVGTGNPMPEHPKQYLGTAIDGRFVWHVYEQLTDPWSITG